MLSVVKELKKSGRTMSQEIGDIVKYANSGELNFRIDDKDGAMKALCDEYLPLHPIRVMDFDGYRIEFSSWWFNVRKSNTEPYLRVVTEAADKELLDLKLNEIKAILMRFK